MHGEENWSGPSHVRPCHMENWNVLCYNSIVSFLMWHLVWYAKSNAIWLHIIRYYVLWNTDDTCMRVASMWPCCHWQVNSHSYAHIHTHLRAIPFGIRGTRPEKRTPRDKRSKFPQSAIVAESFISSNFPLENYISNTDLYSRIIYHLIHGIWSARPRFSLPIRIDTCGPREQETKRRSQRAGGWASGMVFEKTIYHSDRISSRSSYAYDNNRATTAAAASASAIA